MHAGVFAHRISPRHPTGIARYLREVVTALGRLVDDDREVTVISTREREPTDWVPRTVSKHVLPWPRAAVHASWLLGGGPALERATGRFDVIHLIQPFPPVRSRAPQVVTVHDLFPLEHPEWYPRTERFTHRRSLQLQMRRAERIVVPSAYVGRSLQSHLGASASRVDVVPLGVSGAFARSPDDAGVAAACARFDVNPGEYAVCVGAVSARKNLIPVIRASRSAAGVPLLLIGPDGHGSEAIDAEVARSSGRARRTGFLSDADTAALVTGALAVVHPALAEGFGFVPVEAMAAGTPVVASAVASVPEVVGDAASLIDTPSDPAAWTQAVTELREDPERRSQLVQAGRQRAAELTWDRSARALLEIYDAAAAA